MSNNKATLVIDLGFGDAGKGSIVDFLSRRGNVSAVVRFNGGAQAAHNVVLPDGRHHTFSQFGSGTFVPGVKTHLSRFVLVDPYALIKEAEHLISLGIKDPFSRLTVDEDALVVTPFQKAANRIRETMRGDLRHGSCGMGVGETMADSLAFPKMAVRVRDLRDPESLAIKLSAIQEFKRFEFGNKLALFEKNIFIKNECALLMDKDFPFRLAEEMWKISMKFRIVSGKYLKKLSEEGDLIFEGAQGVLLDEWHGFHPYTTWSTITPNNALELLSEINFSGPVQKIGVLRSYYTRHGAGPFPTEDRGLSISVPDFHNLMGAWQGGFRVGWFDAVLARYAVSVCGGIDSLAITCLDRMSSIGRYRYVSAYGVFEKDLEEKEKEAVIFGKNHGGFNKRIISFKPKKVLTDLSYQETLTGLLTKSRPMTREICVCKDERFFLRQLMISLGVPISIISRGNTFLDKKIVSEKYDK